MKYFVIGDEDTVLGFGMVGVDGLEASGEEEAREAFRRALEDRENAIIIMTQRVAGLIRDEVEHYTFSEEFPLILEIPDRRGKPEGAPSLRETVNQAIGIDL